MLADQTFYKRYLLLANKNINSHSVTIAINCLVEWKISVNQLWRFIRLKIQPSDFFT